MPNLAIQSYTFTSGTGRNQWLFTVEYNMVTGVAFVRDVRSPTNLYGAGVFPESLVRDFVVAIDAVRSGTVENLTGGPSGVTGFYVL